MRRHVPAKINSCINIIALSQSAACCVLLYVCFIHTEYWYAPGMASVLFGYTGWYLRKGGKWSEWFLISKLCTLFEICGAFLLLFYLGFGLIKFLGLAVSITFGMWLIQRNTGIFHNEPPKRLSTDTVFPIPKRMGLLLAGVTSLLVFITTHDIRASGIIYAGISLGQCIIVFLILHFSRIFASRHGLNRACYVFMGTILTIMASMGIYLIATVSKGLALK